MSTAFWKFCLSSSPSSKTFQFSEKSLSIDLLQETSKVLWSGSPTLFPSLGRLQLKAILQNLKALVQRAPSLACLHMKVILIWQLKPFACYPSCSLYLSQENVTIPPDNAEKNLVACAIYSVTHLKEGIVWRKIYGRCW